MTEVSFPHILMTPTTDPPQPLVQSTFVHSTIRSPQLKESLGISYYFKLSLKCDIIWIRIFIRYFQLPVICKIFYKIEISSVHTLSYTPVGRQWKLISIVHAYRLQLLDVRKATKREKRGLASIVTYANSPFFSIYAMQADYNVMLS